MEAAQAGGRPVGSGFGRCQVDEEVVPSDVFMSTLESGFDPGAPRTV
jgi:hypothetical protein